MKASQPFEVMQLMCSGASQLKDMANSLPNIAVGSLTIPVHTATLQSSINNSTNRSKNSVKYVAQSPSEEKAICFTLPCETDHLYANYNEATKYRELANEVAHLKALLLFHLDLIQQQSECNASKDKQLSALRHENEMLRQRLERMERRVMLQNQKQKSDFVMDDSLQSSKTSELDSPTHQSSTSNNNTIELQCSEATEHRSCVPETVNNYDSHMKEEDESLPRKRIKTLIPLDTKTVSKDHKENNHTSVMQEAVLQPMIKEEECILSDLINQAVKEGAIINVTDPAVCGGVMETKVVLEESPEPVVQLTSIANNHSPGTVATSVSKVEKRSSSLDALKTKCSILPEHRRIQKLLYQKSTAKEINNVKKDHILTTSQLYPTHVGESHNNSQLENAIIEAEVEVPQWCVKPVTGRYSVQGTENLDDEVFSKRHLKHEIDEKRRKRWDLQRIREQRQYEKLRARYEGEDRSQDRRPSSSCSRNRNEDPGTMLTSLWHQSEDVTHIQVDQWLPVSAFGAPLPKIIPSDFQLPWTISSRTSHMIKNSHEPTSKRRQRR